MGPTDLCRAGEAARERGEHGGGDEGIKDQWNRGYGPLHYAAAAGKVEMCKFLIKDLKVDVHTAQALGIILLFSCSSVGAFPCSMAHVVCKSGLCVGREGLGRVAFALLCGMEGILDCLGENCWVLGDGYGGDW